MSHLKCNVRDNNLHSKAYCLKMCCNSQHYLGKDFRVHFFKKNNGLCFLWLCHTPTATHSSALWLMIPLVLHKHLWLPIFFHRLLGNTSSVMPYISFAHVASCLSSFSTLIFFSSSESEFNHHQMFPGYKRMLTAFSGKIFPPSQNWSPDKFIKV